MFKKVINSILRILDKARKLFRRNKDQKEIQTAPIVPAKKITEEVDHAKFYVGYDFKVNESVELRQPTLEEVIDIGESNYYNMIHAVTSIPSDHISELWDNGVDFQKLPNIEFFSYMTKNVSKKTSSIVFGEKLDFSKLKLYARGDETVLCDNENDVLIDSSDCDRLSQAICAWHGIKKEPVTAAGPMAFRALVEIDRQEKAEISSKKHKSVLIPLLSSAVNHEGFKYNLNDTLKLKMFFFTDCISRIGLRVSADRFAFGFYSGSIDTKKVQPEKQLNWMRDLYS